MPSSNIALPTSDVAIFMYECSGADEPWAKLAKPLCPSAQRRRHLVLLRELTAHTCVTGETTARREVDEALERGLEAADSFDPQARTFVRE